MYFSESQRELLHSGKGKTKIESTTVKKKPPKSPSKRQPSADNASKVVEHLLGLNHRSTKVKVGRDSFTLDFIKRQQRTESSHIKIREEKKNIEEKKRLAEKGLIKELRVSLHKKSANEEEILSFPASHVNTSPTKRQKIDTQQQQHYYQYEEEAEEEEDAHHHYDFYAKSVDGQRVANKTVNVEEPFDSSQDSEEQQQAKVEEVDAHVSESPSSSPSASLFSSIECSATPKLLKTQSTQYPSSFSSTYTRYTSIPSTLPKDDQSTQIIPGEFIPPTQYTSFNATVLTTQESGFNSVTMATSTYSHQLESSPFTLNSHQLNSSPFTLNSQFRASHSPQQTTNTKTIDDNHQKTIDDKYKPSSPASSQQSTVDSSPFTLVQTQPDNNDEQEDFQLEFTQPSAL